MRQKNKHFIAILNRIRIGEHSNEDIKQLNFQFMRKPVDDIHISHLFY